MAEMQEPTTLVKHPSPRIVFMGTPEFAEASLAALVDAGFIIAGVITAPDKPAGRGLKPSQSAVKRYALQKGLTILQPEKLKNELFLEALKALEADLQVVVAFRMLPEVVWTMPPLGTINLHGSLLPQYRGAAPINWAVINGEKETGMTTFRLRHEIDTGDILLQETLPIGETETAGELHDRMKVAGAALLVRTVSGLADGSIDAVAQDELLPASGSHREMEMKHAPKIFTDTCRIDWNKPVEDIYNLIRGLSPYPGAFTGLNNKILKIYRADKIKLDSSTPPGLYETDKKSFIRFACIDGYVSLKEVQLAGKKRMSVDEFLRGYRSDL